MVYSHHSHSGQFCSHGADTLELIVAEAARKGFKMYALTEHCPRYCDSDLYPEEIEAKVSLQDLEETFAKFIAEGTRLRDLYASNESGMEILIGLETECLRTEDLDKLEQLINKYNADIDFIVGSVHHADEHPIDFSKERFEDAITSFQTQLPEPSTDTQSEDFRQGALSKLLESYFTSQRTLMERLRPQVIGHFSLPLLFTPQTRLASHPRALQLAKANIEFGVSYGALFELSSAPFRKGWDEGWPGEEAVKMVLDMGGKFCLSDDAHKVEQVGLNYHRLLAWIQQMGIPEERICRLERGENGIVKVVECRNLFDSMGRMY